MKYILSQPANIRFQWELDVFLTNLRSLDQETSVVLLFLEETQTVIEHFRGRYSNLEIHQYQDSRERRNYIPTIRPYLMWNYLKEDPSRQEHDYFQVDSDIVFRELPDFSRMPLEGKVCWCADCGGYIDYAYLMRCTGGKYIVDKFSEILNISVDKIRTTPGGGAQWLMSRPTAQLWWHIWQDSQILYDFLEPVQSNIQKWTAEMWAQLYNMAKFGWDVRLSPELAFCRPTDPIGDWEKVKILHNAGVTAALADKLFFKGIYTDRTPFLEDFSRIDRAKAGLIYVQAIQKVAERKTL